MKKELSCDLDPEVIRKHVEDNQTLFNLDPTSISPDGWKGKTGLILGANAVKNIAFMIASIWLQEQQNPQVITPGVLVATIASLVALPSFLIYGLKAEGLSFLGRNLGLFFLASLLVFPARIYGGVAGIDQQTINTLLSIFLSPVGTAAMLKNFSNYCRYAWTEYVIAHPKKLLHLLQAYVTARDSNDKAKIIKAVRALKSFVEKAHDNIPMLRKLIG